MDTFSAEGNIFTQLSPNNPIQKEIITHHENKTQEISNFSLSNKNSSKIGNTLQDNSPTGSILNGKWAFEVKRGDPNFFRAIFGVTHNNKIMYAFDIYNLRDTPYIQLNAQGIDIVSGKVDLRVSGLINQTFSDIDAMITILGFSQIKIMINSNELLKYFNHDPVVGTPTLFLDQNGNPLIGNLPRPPLPPNQQQYQSSFHA
ncbi:MAG: hypothetical protein R3321_12335 [Nitrososphaeraceae archaeon]|nr:hypothetical protein [Nitrososphaeraceae archaeon]